MTDELRPIQAPVLRGAMLELVATLAEFPLTAPLIAGQMFRNIDLAGFRRREARGAPVVAPALPRLDVADPGDYAAAEGSEDVDPSAWPRPERDRLSSAMIVAAFRDGRDTPSAFAERLLAALDKQEAGDPPLRAIVALDRETFLAEAAASTGRWAAGEPLGPLDGVPVTIKDETHVKGYPTTIGTSFFGKTPATEDATVVRRLREAGALIFGKANMHEIGIGVTGANPHHGMPLNAYAPGHAPGGSSSGSASLVSAGLCPIALAADGGGSIRIPAAFCGQFGLKPTHGRISEHGAVPLCPSVGHLGPIASNAADLLLAYEVFAGPDPADPASLAQPPVTRPSPRQCESLEGLTIGLDPAWFGLADEAVTKPVRALLDQLVETGATLQEIKVEGLAALRQVQLVTIATEMAQHQSIAGAPRLRDYGRDVRLNLALARALRATDYLQAQRLRRDLCDHIQELFESVDLIVTPMTACLPPAIPEAVVRGGESNLGLLDRIMRFAPLANVTGIPALTVPSGVDEGGRPSALQLFAPAWREDRLLRAAFVAERLVTMPPAVRATPPAELLAELAST